MKNKLWCLVAHWKEPRYWCLVFFQWRCKKCGTLWGD